MKLQNTHLNIEPDAAFGIWSNIEKRIKWDTRWIKTDVLFHEGNEWVLYYMIPKPPIPFFSQRDNLCKFWIVENYGEGKKLMVGTSVEHEKYPVKTGMFDNIRANVDIAAMLVEKNPNGAGTRLTEIRSIDLGGSIPNAIINQMTTMMPKGVFQS